MQNDSIKSEMQGNSGRIGLVTLVFFALIIFISASVYFPLRNQVKGQGGAGAIWTTTGSCGDPQNVNHYNWGDTVFINGSGFEPSTNHGWIITGNSNGSKCDPDTVVASGNLTINSSGAFCIQAYTIPTDDCGEYTVDVVGASKNDNYRVNEGPSPTPVASVSPVPTPGVTPSPTIQPSPTPVVSPSPSAIPSPTVEPSPTASPSPSSSAEPTPDVSATPLVSVSPSPTPSSTPASTPEPTASPSPTPTPIDSTPTPAPATTPTPTPGQVLGETTAAKSSGQVLGSTTTLGATGENDVLLRLILTALSSAVSMGFGVSLATQKARTDA